LIQCCSSVRDLHSFPTRRSSDLPFSLPRAHFEAVLLLKVRRPLGRGFCSLELSRWPEPGFQAAFSAPRRLSNGHLQKRQWRPKLDRKSTRLNSSHQLISYAVFSL